MEEICEEESEGTINLPKIMKVSNKSLLEKKIELKDYKIKNNSSNNVNDLLLGYNLADNYNEKKNNNFACDKNKFWFKNEDNNSTTAKSSNEDKIKKVTFSTVEIIRVKNYKRYNLLNTVKKKEEEDDEENNNCIMF